MDAHSKHSGKSLSLLYHELRPESCSYTYALTCAEFEKQMDLFARLQREAPGGYVRPEVTFDDGHVSNYEYALPVLAQHALCGMFFITAGWAGAKAGYMDWEQIRALDRGGQRIGAHGMTHALLTHCSTDELDRELRGARHLLEDKLAVAVTAMSLPGGRYNRRVLEACREAGYKQIFTSHPRAESIPPGELPGRLNIRGEMKLDWIERLLQPASGILASLERSDRIKDAAKTLLGDRIYGMVWAVLNRQEPETEAR